MERPSDESLTPIKKYYASLVFQKVITQSGKMMEIFESVSKILEVNTTVLIHGETGTGKELIAKVIHFNGPRREKPFVAVNCASIPDELFESELFGSKKGAFTGASEDRKGSFQTADGGTLLLDEIGEMPLKLQSKLLRVIEDKKIKSLGSEKSIDVDVRIIATTNRNLALEVEKKNFREDLFYRLNVIPIELPPLRERKEDILLLVDFFIDKYAESLRKPVKSITDEAVNTLLNHSWPGNVRELENAIERAMILEKGDTITYIGNLSTNKEMVPIDFAANFKTAKAKTVEDFEKTYIVRLLDQYGGKTTQAAKHAGIDRKNFIEKMKKYGLKKEAFFKQKTR